MTTGPQAIGFVLGVIAVQPPLWALPGEAHALPASQAVGVPTGRLHEPCAYDDPLLALACKTNPLVRERLRTHGRGAATVWFSLGPEIGGYAPNMFNNALLSSDPGASALALSWRTNHPRRAERIRSVEEAIGLATNQTVKLAKLHIIALDAHNMVACGYAFADGGGFEPASSGAFVWDTRSAPILRATPELMRARCAAADAVVL